MKKECKNTNIALIAFLFCSIFVVQIALDIALKLGNSDSKITFSKLNKLKSNNSDDHSDDDQEKEIENDDDEDSKELQPILFLALHFESKITTRQAQTQYANLPSGFLKTFTPPPEL